MQQIALRLVKKTKVTDILFQKTESELHQTIEVFKANIYYQRRFIRKQ